MNLNFDLEPNQRFLLTFLSEKYNEIIIGEDIQFFETKKSKIWLINPNCHELDPNLLERIDNVNYHSWEVGGIWSVFIQDIKKGSYRAISSINNELPWYFSITKPLAISNNLSHISLNTGFNKPDFISIASHLGLDWSVAGYTFIDGLFKSYGGSILYFIEGSIFEKKVDLKIWLGFDNSVDNPNLLINRIN